MTTLMPAESVPKFYYITHLCEMEQNGKFNFFQFFQNQNRILLFEYFTYIKNVIFWGISSWCSSKIELLEGGSKAAIVAYERPLTLYQILSYINMMYLKRSHFLCRQSIQTAKFYFVFEKAKKINFLFCPNSHSTQVKSSILSPRKIKEPFIFH